MESLSCERVTSVFCLGEVSQLGWYTWQGVASVCSQQEPSVYWDAFASLLYDTLFLSADIASLVLDL